ncbi:EAL domain, c-di-GMP-specific phosphodiesterase class I (or its enzymatically inactive variant) [Bacillus sp. OV322]|uniref:EAL-associated domain-containing protein n=1 Tax=Bacillus sp. OV322 TaxID=1882764 RepID=UPI0008E4E7BF|nr:EAL-associated domain-containing protein [Bacillus sp. OV322]SFC03293.1 EAL domain, c-di-GMP-specific phosphodiesterase class I (or its enzymatically inactive variant) [Bacillus sp. OV322]
MDADEIITHPERIQPFFQPVFSADEHMVCGYEILGSYQNGNDYQSLDPFFQDKSIPEEYRNEVANQLLEKALDIIAAEKEEFLIFINRDPGQLMSDHGESFLEIIKNRLAPAQYSRVVLQLTDREHTEAFDSFLHVLTYYKTYGIKISLKHIGEERLLDRFALISPHILVVSLEELKKSGSDAMQITLYSLGILARKIGANLLFESIDRDYQLRFALKNGGRYYQGGYLALPGSSFIPKDLLKEKIKEESQRYISFEMRKLEIVYQRTLKINEDIQLLLSKHKKFITYESLLKSLTVKLESMCFRLYICNEEGYQKSANFLKKDGSWTVQEEYLEKNWSWRPYFLENIIRMRNEKKGILSDLYSDIETGETIRTFSYPLDGSHYLFLDLSYDYLYENEELL